MEAGFYLFSGVSFIVYLGNSFLFFFPEYNFRRDRLGIVIEYVYRSESRLRVRGIPYSSSTSAATWSKHHNHDYLW